MKASNNCIALIMQYEKFRSRPYLCPAGKPTIGYGTTHYPDGDAVKLSDSPISEIHALELVWHDVLQFEKDVNSLLKVSVTQMQFDALVCFAYNVGSDIDSDDIAEGLGDSTLLKLVNADVMHTAADWKRQITKQFLSWKYGTVKGVKTVLGGLVKRRTSEALLFTDNILQFFN